MANKMLNYDRVREVGGLETFVFEYINDPHGSKTISINSKYEIKTNEKELEDGNDYSLENFYCLSNYYDDLVEPKYFFLDQNGKIQYTLKGDDEFQQWTIWDKNYLDKVEKFIANT